MVVGIAFVLMAVVTMLRVMTRLRWVSQDLSDDSDGMTQTVLGRRNRQQRALSLGGVVAVGLCSYLNSVGLAAPLIGRDMGPPP